MVLLLRPLNSSGNQDSPPAGYGLRHSPLGRLLGNHHRSHRHLGYWYNLGDNHLFINWFGHHGHYWGNNRRRGRLGHNLRHNHRHG